MSDRDGMRRVVGTREACSCTSPKASPAVRSEAQATGALDEPREVLGRVTSEAPQIECLHLQRAVDPLQRVMGIPLLIHEERLVATPERMTEEAGSTGLDGRGS